MTWVAIDSALYKGSRGLPGGSSLADALEKAGHKKNIQKQPYITVEQILEAAVQFHSRTSKWPSQHTKEIVPDGALKDMTWQAIHTTLYKGTRGLPGGSSLPDELEKAGHKKNRSKQPDITVAQILEAAVNWHTRTKDWPSGDIKERIPDGALKDLTWVAIDSALYKGSRGLPGGSSLPDELEKAGHKKNLMKQPDITVEQILEAAVQFHARTGEWASARTKERISDGALKGMAWKAINSALYKGNRGLPGETSLLFVLKPFKEAAKEGRLEEFVRARLGDKSGEGGGTSGSSPISNPPPGLNI
jgi:hypothetical protein